MTLICRHLLESTLMAAAIVVLARFLRNRSASTRYAVLLSAVIKFIVPIAGLVRLGVEFGSVFPSHYSVLLRNAHLSMNLYPVLTAPAAASANSAHYWFVFIPEMVWLSGSLAMFALWIHRAVAFPPQNENPAAAEVALIDRLRRRFGIRRAVRLQYSVPNRYELGLWGFWHPTIRIPRELPSQLTPAEFESVLLHELAHVRRQDNLFGLFAHCVVCVFWFDPLLWWIERRLVAEREQACDELVIRSGASPSTYVNGILKVCRFQISDAVAGTSGMNKSGLKDRLELIMSYRSHDRASRSRLVLGALATIMTVVPFVAGFIQESALNAQTREEKQTLADSNAAACFAGDVKYPQGTVIQMTRSTKKECSQGSWVPTAKPATAVFHQKPVPPCRIEPSTSPDACQCQNGTYSLGAITQDVNHAFIRCDRFELGKFTTWRSATPSELGRR